MQNFNKNIKKEGKERSLMIKACPILCGIAHLCFKRKPRGQDCMILPVSSSRASTQHTSPHP